MGEVNGEYRPITETEHKLVSHIRKLYKRIAALKTELEELKKNES